MYHSFLIHSSADGHPGCFHVLAIINSVAMNIGVHMEIKAKINKWDLIKLKTFAHKKGNHKQGEKTAFRMGENNIK